MQKQVLLAGGKPVPLNFPTPQQMPSFYHMTLLESTIIPALLEMQLPVRHLGKDAVYCTIV